MAKGPLRTAIEDAARENLNPGGQPGYWGRVHDRWAEYWGIIAKINAANPSYGLFNGAANALSGSLYALTGAEFFIIKEKKDLETGGKVDISELVADILKGATGNPVAQELAETIGAFITEPILALFERYAGDDTRDPKEMARAFHGLMIGLTSIGGLFDTGTETATAGQVDGIGRFLNSMYWSLGLGFLGWQTLAPLLESGLQPGLDRYYKKLYRSARFSAGDLRDLYALGKITQEQLYDEARFLGWRDQDIPYWLELSFRTLGQGDIFAAYYKGYISQDEAVRRLRLTGVNPDDMELLFKLNPDPNNESEKAVTLTTARNAYKEHLIDETEFRSLLADLDKSQQEIDLIVSIEDAKAQTTARGLSVAQIKAAWQDNVLGDTEARHWLETSGLSSDKIDIILDTWKAELAPVFRKLNTGTILGAYVEGVINRGAAAEKLTSVGLSADDAELEIKLAEVRNPQNFGQIAPVAARRLSPSLLSDLVSLGLITPSQMVDRLVAGGYTQEDASLLAEAARIKAQPGARKLSQGTVTGAYVAGVIDRAQAEGYLSSLGFGAPEVKTILDTVEQQNAAAFGLPAEQKVKTLSPSALEDLYLGDVISRDDYLASLLALGFSETDAGNLATRADQFKAPGQRVITQNTIERAYLAGVFDRQAAYNKLVASDFSPEDANTILDTVESENPQAFTPGLVQSLRVPSITVLVAALRNGVITEQEYYARAQELGYAQSDAELYLSVAVTNERKNTKGLTQAQILRAYNGGFFTRGETLQRLMEQGLSNEDAVLLIRMEKDIIENTDTWDNLLSGALAPFDAIAELINAKYSDGDILAAFEGLPAQTLVAMGIDIPALQETLAAIPGGQ